MNAYDVIHMKKCDLKKIYEFEPAAKSAKMEIFRPHVKFLIMLIPIEMMGFLT